MTWKKATTTLLLFVDTLMFAVAALIVVVKSRDIINTVSVLNILFIFPPIIFYLQLYVF